MKPKSKRPAPDWRAIVQERNPDALFIGEPGETRFDRAIVGIGERCGQPPLLVYDYELVVEVLVEGGMPQDEAEEFADFNIVGAWMGENTPLFLYRELAA
jgi:hypothetical protein